VGVPFFCFVANVIVTYISTGLTRASAKHLIIDESDMDWAVLMG